ncbi:hypothetical protein Y032_0311g2161, partial [Ancylostoma ceylanicum]
STVVIRVRRRSKWGNTWRRAQRWVGMRRRPKVCKRLLTGRQMEKSERKCQMPGLSSDYHTTHVILPASRPLLRVLPSSVSEHTAPSSFTCSD